MNEVRERNSTARRVASTEHEEQTRKGLGEIASQIERDHKSDHDSTL